MEAVETDAPTGLDIAAASAQIGSDLFPEQDASPASGTDEPAAAAPPPADAAAPSIREAPKSWAKEQHEIWSKIDPKGQDYIEKREKDFLDGLEQYKTDAQWAKTIRDT